MAGINISEVFYSIQGETSLVGKPCIFIRLAGCNLRCSWCDTEYAQSGGRQREVEQLIQEVKKFNCRVAVITGGEPLIQAGVYELMNRLIKEKFMVVLETNGSRDISRVPDKVKIILDIKTPSSGESDKMNLSNVEKLKKDGELKFVISDRNDFIWSKKILSQTDFKGEVLISPVKDKISIETLCGWVKKELPDSRVQFNPHHVYKIR
ncbi:MAG: 7-carboxy-7-deazaguanine synthase QueE [Elusimicrobiota bacterium]